MKIYRGSSDFKPDERESIIAASKRNNATAQRALIKNYYGYVKSITFRYTSNNQDAEEILNDSFLKVFNNLDKYDESQAFKAWLRTIVVNTAIDHFRKNRQHNELTVYEEAEKQYVTDVNEDIISRISAEEILELVRGLSPAYRMVFSLYVIDGYTHKEIADKLGINEGTSKSNLQDARRKLQNMISKVYPKVYNAYELKTVRQNED